jgi:hypothetical protein
LNINSPATGLGRRRRRNSYELEWSAGRNNDFGEIKIPLVKAVRRANEKK